MEKNRAERIREIKATREEKGIGGFEFAVLSKISSRKLCRAEKGEIFLSHKVLDQLANSLDSLNLKGGEPIVEKEIFQQKIKENADKEYVGPIKLLKEYREKQGLSIGAVSRMSGVSKGQLSRAERGETDLTLGTYQRVLQGLGLSFGELERIYEQKEVVGTILDLGVIIHGLPSKERQFLTLQCWQVVKAFMNWKCLTDVNNGTENANI